MKRAPAFPRGWVLASASPRRRALLPWLGLPVRVHPVNVPEVPEPGETPQAYVRRLALAKARALPPEAVPPGWWVLAADTAVVHDGKILGKPRSRDEARAMLQALQGREHTVFTGFALREPRTEWHHVEVVGTRVRMRPMSAGDIEAYLDSGRPMDKAGAYGIQDAPFHPVESLGPVACFANVVGLPLCHLWHALTRLTIPPGGGPPPNLKARCWEAWGYACPVSQAVGFLPEEKAADVPEGPRPDEKPSPSPA